MGTEKSQIERWNELYGYDISLTDYEEICSNLKGFFGSLKQWSNDVERKSGNERHTDKRSLNIPHPS